MADRPLVSAILPAYNNGALACEAVRSVLAQTWRPIECVVADDGSDDGTLDMLRQFGGAIRLVSIPHQGIPFARNAAIRASRGAVLAFLDSDDLWRPNKVEKCVNRLAEKPGAGVVYTRVTVHDLVKRQQFELAVYDKEGWIAPDLFVECRMSTSTLVVRRECMDKVGLFDEELLRAQDWDIMVRLAEAFPYAFVNEPLTTRCIHSANISVRRSDLYARYNLMVIHKALARRPDLYTALAPLALSKAHVRFGLEHYRRFDMAPARAEFFRSLRCRPNREALSYWVRTFLPVPWVRALRRWRERHSAQPLPPAPKEGAA